MEEKQPACQSPVSQSYRPHLPGQPATVSSPAHGFLETSGGRIVDRLPDGAQKAVIKRALRLPSLSSSLAFIAVPRLLLLLLLRLPVRCPLHCRLHLVLNLGHWLKKRSQFLWCLFPLLFSLTGFERELCLSQEFFCSFSSFRKAL